MMRHNDDKFSAEVRSMPGSVNSEVVRTSKRTEKNCRPSTTKMRAADTLRICRPQKASRQSRNAFSGESLLEGYGHERISDEGKKQDVEYPEVAGILDDGSLMDPFRIAVQDGGRSGRGGQCRECRRE